MKTFELSAITTVLFGGIIHFSNAQGVASLPMIAAGGYSGITVRVDGSMWAWGKLNALPPLNPLVGLRPMLVPQPPTAAPGSTWVKTALGGRTLAALRSDATLWLWGEGNEGQLGTGIQFDQATAPRQLATSAGAGWAQVVPTELTTLALRTDGTLWSWGQGEGGLLGDGVITQHRQLVPGAVLTPLTAQAGTFWIQIAAGETHALALRSDGTLWAWGNNLGSRLGVNGTAPPYVAVPQPVIIPSTAAPGTVWTAIAAGRYHTLALRSDGTLWAWGLNPHGQLGVGGLLDRVVPTEVGNPTTAVPGTTWASIAAGRDHSLALRSDGSLWAWGYNQQGGLGDNTSRDRDTPVQEFTRGTWTQVVGGEDYSLAVSGGRLFATGGLDFSSNYGQLGDGTRNGSAYFRPTLAPVLPTKAALMRELLVAFPNPTTAWVQLHGIPMGTLVKVSNLLGQFCRQSTVGPAGIDLRGLAAGMYTLQIVPEGGVPRLVRVQVD